MIEMNLLIHKWLDFTIYSRLALHQFKKDLLLTKCSKHFEISSLLADKKQERQYYCWAYNQYFGCALYRRSIEIFLAKIWKIGQ